MQLVQQMNYKKNIINKLKLMNQLDMHLPEKI